MRSSMPWRDKLTIEGEGLDQQIKAPTECIFFGRRLAVFRSSFIPLTVRLRPVNVSELTTRRKSAT